MIPVASTNDGRGKLPEALPEPCNECPWLRDSAPGWLGGYTAEDWTRLAHSDDPVACHQTVDHEGEWTPGTAQCRGVAIYRANVAKRPRGEGIAHGPLNRDMVFSGPLQFLDHHCREDGGEPAEEAGGGRSTGVEFTSDQVRWLQSQVRMYLRRMDRDIARVQPRPGQSEADAEAFRRSLESKRGFAEETLVVLQRGREALTRSKRESQ